MRAKRISSSGLATGSGPPALTAMVISLPMRANCFAIRSHRANIVCLRVSKMRPMIDRSMAVEECAELVEVAGEQRRVAAESLPLRLDGGGESSAIGGAE